MAQARMKFKEVTADWNAESSPVFNEGEAPKPATEGTTWDLEGSFPIRDFVTMFFASDMVSQRPVQKKFEFWFSYIRKEDNPAMFSKLTGRRFKLLGIYGKGKSPNPEEITPDTTNKDIHHIQNYYRTAFRATLKEAIADKLEANFDEIQHLSDVVNRATTNVKIGVDA